MHVCVSLFLWGAARLLRGGKLKALRCRLAYLVSRSGFSGGGCSLAELGKGGSCLPLVSISLVRAPQRLIYSAGGKSARQLTLSSWPRSRSRVPQPFFYLSLALLHSSSFFPLIGAKPSSPLLSSFFSLHSSTVMGNSVSHCEPEIVAVRIHPVGDEAAALTTRRGKMLASSSPPIKR